MKTLFGISAAILVAVFPASVRAADITPEQRAAYLACYRRVLAEPVFAGMDSAELYRIREEGLARMVIMACGDEMEPYGRKLLEDALRAPRGDTPPPEGWLLSIFESGRRRQVAADLVEVAPRVKPYADAEAGNAPGGAER
jgi:hypothetical protein